MVICRESRCINKIRKHQHPQMISCSCFVIVSRFKSVNKKIQRYKIHTKKNKVKSWQEKEFEE